MHYILKTSPLSHSRTFPSSPYGELLALISHRSPQLSPHSSNSWLTFCPWISLFCMLYVDEISHSVANCMWLLSCTVFLRFVHVVVCTSASFPFMAVIICFVKVDFWQPFHQLMVVWVASVFWQLWMMFLSTLMFKCFCGFHVVCSLWCVFRNGIVRLLNNFCTNSEPASKLYWTVWWSQNDSSKLIL